MKSATAAPVQAYEFGDFRLGLDERRLVRGDGTAVLLTPRVFATLRYLVEHSGRVLTKDELMNAVWPDCVVEENNLAQNISTLRRAFGDTAGSQRYIVTVPGRGYRFVPEVRATEAAPQIATPASEEAIGASGVPTTSAEPPVGPTRRPALPLLITALAMVALCAVAILVWPTSRGARLRPAHSAGHPERSIAVLPFANLSGDPANAYFADGVRDEILARLSKIGTLQVISRTSAEKFKTDARNIREIAQQLGVANILEGSVQRSGDQVRVTVQLIRAESDTHLWAETYDRNIADIFQVETEIAARVAASLAATLTGSESHALRAWPTQNVEAHQAYLKGRYFWNKRSSDGYKQAIHHFNRAIELDPSYAVAYAGLADAILFLGGDSIAAQHEAVARGRAALQKALELDESLGEAHASLGLVHVNFDWDWPAAEQEFKRALVLNPGYATAHQWYGEFATSMGRFDEGIAELKRARDLDPLSLVINTDLGKVYLLARRYEEATAQFKSALEMDPQFTVARGLLAITYSLRGLHEEAAAEIRSVKDLENAPMHVAWLGCIEGLAGKDAEAERAALRLQQLSAETYVSPVWMLFVYAAARQREQAFSWAEKVISEHAVAGAIPLKVNPIFDSLRSDPRYADLLRRTNFDP